MQAGPVQAPSPTRSRWPARIGLMLFGAVLAVLVTVAVNWPSHTPGRAFTQPDTATYDDGLRHRVGIVTESQPLGDDRYLLYAGSDPGMTYGHFVQLGTGPLGGDGPVRITRAVWTRQGVETTLATGHRIFIPARSFTGGR